MNQKSVNAEFEKTKNKLLEIKKILAAESDSELENKILKKRLNMLSCIMNNVLDGPTRNKIYRLLVASEQMRPTPENYLSISDISSCWVCISDKEIGQKE